MDKIFISIASYRDPELIPTVQDLITKSENPQLLRIVVHEQNDFTDPSILGMYPEWQVQVIQTHYSEAKGPTWARYIIQQAYSDEEYYLQIDSHMRVIQNWDTKLKHMLDLVPEPAVLTQYPPEYSLDSGEFDIQVIRSGLYIQGFGIKDGFTRIQSDVIDYANRTYFPYTSKGWSACFSFSKGNLIQDAPYDPQLPHLFFGEELDITLRLFTRGWYFYSPHELVIFTSFKRTNRRTYWQDIPEKHRTLDEFNSRMRIWKRILSDPNDDLFSMGTVRTVHDYMKFADIESFVYHKLTKRAKSWRRPTKRVLNK